MRSSQWQYVRSSFERPNFSEPNSSATGPDARRLRDQPAGIFHGAQRVLQFAMTQRGGTNHQAAIGDGFGQRRKFLRRAKNRERCTAERAS